MSDVTGNENESLADSALRRYESDNSLGADEIRALAKRVLELEDERDAALSELADAKAKIAELELQMARFSASLRPG